MPRVTHAPTHFACARRTKLTSPLHWNGGPHPTVADQRGRSVAIYLHNMAGPLTGKIVIGPLVYVRIHGPTKRAGHYDDRLLEH